MFWSRISGAQQPTQVCVFRAIRSPVPRDDDQPFHGKPITCSGVTRLGTTVRNGELSLNPDLFKTVELTVYSPRRTAAMIIVASLIARLPMSIVVMAVAWRGGIGAPFGGHF